MQNNRWAEIGIGKSTVKQYMLLGFLKGVFITRYWYTLVYYILFGRLIFVLVQTSLLKIVVIGGIDV